MRSSNNVIGLDISTSITGISVFNDEGKCVYNEFVDTRNKNKYPDLYKKARHLRTRLIAIEGEYSISSIYIEQSLHSFRSGFSSAQVLSKLSRFNGMMSWICYQLFGKMPEMISASTARKTAGITVRRGENAKQKCFDFVVDEYPDFVVEYTRNGNLKPGILDKSDSYIIAKAGWEIWKKENLNC
tara:strand:- start:14620 stop:15174 length:555 start_codon:yes stop_codon:yes gene_type:complete